MEAVVEQIVDELFEPPGNSGLLVGVLQGSQTSFFGFGQKSERHAEPPDLNTLFEIGSVTKVFTASLLSSLVEEGLLNLDDSVMDLLQVQAQIPSEISFLRLATHTSGLPKMPSNLMWAMLKNRKNPYAVYSRSDLNEYLSKLKLRRNSVTKAKVEYSNLGYVLLGNAIENKLDSSYEKALIQRICDPMELVNTRIALSYDQQQRLAPPHSNNGRPNQNWNLDVFAGAGALRSTGSDLLRFLAFNLGPAHTSLSSTLEACHTVRVESSPPSGAIQKILGWLGVKGINAARYRNGIGLGWTVGRSSTGIGQIHWHHGATGGYRAFIGFNKDRGVATVVLANSGPSFIEALLSTASTDAIGFRILERLATT